MGDEREQYKHSREQATSEVRTRRPPTHGARLRPGPESGAHRFVGLLFADAQTVFYKQQDHDDHSARHSDEKRRQ